MRVLEYDGKSLFVRYGIAVPRGSVLRSEEAPLPSDFPVVMKAHIAAGGRGRAGGVRTAVNEKEARVILRELLGATICSIPVDAVLVEDYITSVCEWYVSLSYDSATRGPVLAVSTRGGVDVASATIIPINVFQGVRASDTTHILESERIPPSLHRVLVEITHALWRCFVGENLLLAEINPLFIMADGRAIAGDAKVITDDDITKPNERRCFSLGGDIAVLASGGGASLLNIDALMAYGGHPANYTEYSGNPSADVVRDLTIRVLSQPNLCGCWVIGGTANFTDIYETMRGFVDGLRMVQPKPTYPIVIRRDGPRQTEAFAMLRDVAVREGYQVYMFDSETSMEESARIMVKLAYGDSRRSNHERIGAGHYR